MIRKHIREHSVVYQLLLILGGTLLLGGGFILAVKKMQRTREIAYDEKAYTEEEIEAVEQKPEEQVFPQPIGNERYSLRHVLRYALEAHGGREALENIFTIRRIGTIELFGSEMEQNFMKTTIIYRKPDMLRYIYQLEENSIVAGYDGSKAWRQAYTKDAILPAEDLSPKDLRLLKQDLVTIRPLSATLGDLANLSLLEDSESDATDSPYRVQYEIGWMNEVLFFNKKSFMCERRDILLQIPDEDPIEIRLEYENFRYIDKCVFPFFVRVWIDGEKRNEVTLDTIEVNIGILPLVFRRPED